MIHFGVAQFFEYVKNQTMRNSGEEIKFNAVFITM